ALYVQALKAVEALGTEAGVSGEALNNVAAALALAAQKQGLTEVTGAMRSFTGYMLAFQGDMSKEQTRHCSVNIDEAKSQPAAKTLESMSQRTQSFATVAQQDSPAIHDSPTHRKLT
ncbi:MAG: hypothetical protein NT117_00420, partial [Gammaproteobacteria bacterium]|nr:hypothetical protein [Gammaproteobacteria bacterium]